jgi:hypothetical protein
MVISAEIVCKRPIFAFSYPFLQQLQRMKQSRVYLLAFLLALTCTVSMQSCARKSGCAAIESTVKPSLKKSGKPKGKSSELFGKKMRKKM